MNSKIRKTTVNVLQQIFWWSKNKGDSRSSIAKSSSQTVLLCEKSQAKFDIDFTLLKTLNAIYLHVQNWGWGVKRIEPSCTCLLSIRCNLFFILVHAILSKGPVAASLQNVSALKHYPLKHFTSQNVQVNTGLKCLRITLYIQEKIIYARFIKGFHWNLKRFFVSRLPKTRFMLTIAINDPPQWKGFTPHKELINPCYCPAFQLQNHHNRAHLWYFICHMFPLPLPFPPTPTYKITGKSLVLPFLFPFLFLFSFLFPPFLTTLLHVAILYISIFLVANMDTSQLAFHILHEMKKKTLPKTKPWTNKICSTMPQ